LAKLKSHQDELIDSLRLNASRRPAYGCWDLLRRKLVVPGFPLWQILLQKSAATD